MTAHARIACNVLATYARSAYALILGVFAARWLLMSLGATDLGLWGLVGGLVGFVRLGNLVLADAVGRFYAYSVGAARRNPEDGNAIRDCQGWFSTAVMLHTAIPLLLVLIGWPVGEYAVRHCLVIPAGRVEDCVRVWWFACGGCFFSMVSVPYSAMYKAKQEIAELSVYDFVATTANFLVLYYMVCHPGSWLVRYAFWNMLILLLPSTVYMIRAFFVFPECRLVPAEMVSLSRIRQILWYSSCRFLVLLANVINTSGVAVLVNRMLGPVHNAALTIGNNLADKTQVLSKSVAGAFYPAITNAAGEGDLDRMRSLAFLNCKLSSIAVLVFAVPLAAEIEEVMFLWLKEPPAGAGALCLAMMGVWVLDMLSDGHWKAVFALGKVGAINVVEAVLWLLVLPLAWCLIRLGLDVVSVGLALVFAKSLAVFNKLYFAKTIAGMSVRQWIRGIFVPVTVAVSSSLAIGVLPRLFLTQSLLRLAVSAVSCEVTFLTVGWFCILEDGEREWILRKLKRVLGRTA